MRYSIRSTLVLLIVTASTVHAQHGVRVTARPDSRLWLEGTSNVSSWSCRATAIDAALLFATGALPQDPAVLAERLEQVVVRVPVSSLKCGNGRMDRNMYKALHGANPQESDIRGTFAVQDVTERSANLQTVGTLTVAGRDKTLGLEVRTRRDDDGTIVAEGSMPVLMTDFGIAPPSVFFGAIRTGNRVVVRFELRVSADAATLAAAQPAGKRWTAPLVSDEEWTP